MDRDAVGNDRMLDASQFGREILGAVPGGAIIAFDVEMRISFAEGAELGKRGYQPDSMRGQLLSDVLPAEAWESVRGPYERALQGETVRFETHRQLASYSVLVSPVTDDDRIVGAISVAHGISEHRRLENVVSDQDAIARDSEQLLATVFDRAPIGMSVVDLDLNWIRVNDAYCRMFGYSREELFLMTFRDLSHPDELEQDIEWQRLAKEGKTDGFERDSKYVSRDGSDVWVHARAELIRDKEGRPEYTITLLEDITGARQDRHDLLTSERELRMVLNNIPDAVSVQGRDFRYRLVNDAFESRFGVARNEILGQRDDEVLSPEAIAQDRASHVRVLRTGERVQQEEIVPLGGEDHIFQTVKFPLLDENRQIYAVCGVFNDITDRKRREEELEDRLTWTERIHSGIAQNRLVLHGQPIVELATGEVKQAELLVRMIDRRKAGELLSPGEFLPAAERLSLISSIDHWVVARALEIAVDHRVEINLSGLTISDPEHVEEIERMVSECPAPRENIIFEITETAVAENLASARIFAERLREMGCSFALDDFGVGFGTFTYLKHLPVDYLKIDIEFVRDLIRDDTDKHVVSAIVGAADLFGMKTIAEGVEDQETQDLLLEMGVDFAQGYWVGRPIPMDELWGPKVPIDENRGADGRSAR